MGGQIVSGAESSRANVHHSDRRFEMKRTPTDLAILNVIYESYYDTFPNYENDPSSRSTYLFVPIDIEALAKNLRVNKEIIFGRLYYHLEARYGYKQDDGARVHFFALNMGRHHHRVHFPYLASVLASLREEHHRFQTVTLLALGSFLISVLAVSISVFL
ncbi:MAG: hypothetical protein QF659_00415 [Dehalococcoidia bacterium]|nr:hypothetical protein [Dehalococcoidia bacterium]